MDLPEIRTTVGRFLSRPSLAAAALVCKSWNATFCPILYSVVFLRNPTKTYCKDGIISNAEHVQELGLSISIGLSVVDYMYLDNQLRFPALKVLRLTISQHEVLIEQQLESKCPAMRELSWYITDFHSYPVSDICDLFKSYCPFIEHLDLNSGHLLEDKDLSLILDNCYKVKHFLVIPSRFGELTFRSLVRHFEHLQGLDCKESALTSKMAQTIMTQCYNLIRFGGVTLEARDILGIMDGNAVGGDTMMHPCSQDWVCTKLCSLSIFICGLGAKPLEWHRKVFQQLGKLERLVFLTPGPGSAFNGQSSDGLDFRLVAGLGLLSNLKRLCLINVRRLVMQVEEQDAKWMAEAWPKLRQVGGNLHYDSERHLEVIRILRERDISMFPERFN